MKLSHFEALAPRCPVCRARRADPRLEIGPRLVEADGEIVEGALVCSEPSCQHEYPVIDGIPFIVPDVRRTLSAQLTSIRARDDLSPFIESLLGDCAGPDSELERARYHASSYGRSHWGDLDPEQPAEGGFAPLAIAALEMLAADLAGAGVWLDLGCGPGRASFELAARTEGLVLGIDLNVDLLRIAHRARRGRIEHPLRRVGLAYDRRGFDLELTGADRVDFWACDVMALPLADGVATGALSLNLLDCVASPLAHLRETGRALAAGRPALFASPFDWSSAATPVEGWIGGHSQRGPQRGASDIELARLLGDGDPARAGTGLVIEDTRDALDWGVYVHERAAMRYRVHVARARKRGRS